MPFMKIFDVVAIETLGLVADTEKVTTGTHIEKQRGEYREGKGEIRMLGLSH